MSESEEELVGMLEQRQITIFQNGVTLIGCGFFIPIIDQRPYVDLGMWVHPDFRGRGFAKQIISQLKTRARSQGLVPICGCASDNVASRHALEANGFRSQHQLIEFAL